MCVYKQTGGGAAVGRWVERARRWLVGRGGGGHGGPVAHVWLCCGRLRGCWALDWRWPAGWASASEVL